MINVDALTEVEKRAIRREYLSRLQSEQSSSRELKPSSRELEIARRIDSELFEKQANFLNSPAPRKLGFCSRRAGKTVGLVREMCRVLLRNPTSFQIYFAQTSLAAKTYCWAKLKEIIRRLDLPFAWNEQDLWIIHKRGEGKLILRGAEDDDNLDKHRGPAYLRLYIDEAGHIRKNIEKIITEVGGPAMRECNGQALMTGTAGDQRTGYFFRACEGTILRKSDGLPVWEVHEWDLHDNPHIPPSAKIEANIIDEDGYDGPDDPRFLREYKRIWAVDSDRRMFAFNPSRNVYNCALDPEHEWQSLLGCDFGWQDQSAIVLVYYSLTHPNVYIAESWAAKHQYTDDIAAKIMEFRARTGVTRYVGDVGGYGKGVQVHLLRDYGIHVAAAKKREKLDHLAFFNSALKRGELMIKHGDGLITQFPRVEWNSSRTGAANHAKDDRCFAALYAWREAKSSGAASRIRKTKEVEHDTLTQLVIQEKLDVLNAKEQKDDYAHKRVERHRHRYSPRSRVSALHQLIARRRP